MNSGKAPFAAGTLALMATTMLVGASMPAWSQQPIELAPVEVSGKAVKDVEASAIIDQQQIDQEQPKDLRELFRHDPSVTVGGGAAAAQKFYVHGIEQNKLNVSVDGVTQRSNIWHHNGSMTLDPMFLKSVQVEAGVSPADAGPGALGGSVKMETKNARDMLLPGQTEGGTVIASYNTNSQSFRTTGAGYAARDGFEMLGIGSRQKGENYINGNGDMEAGTKDSLLTGLGKLAYESTSGNRFGLSGEWAEDHAIRRFRPNMGEVSAGATGRLVNTTRATRLTAGATYETTAPTATFDPKVNLFYNRVGLQRPNDTNQTAAASGVFNATLETMGLKAQNTFAIPTGKLTAGFDFENTDTYVRRYLQRTDADEQMRNYGLFTQARVTPWTDWKLSTGLRADYQTYHSVDEKDFNNFGLSPNASAEYALTPALSAFGGYSYVFGGMELPETGLLHAADYTVRDDVDPTRSHNFRTGLRYGEGGLKLEGALFRTVMLNTYGENSARVRISGPGLRSQGVDLSGGYDWANAKVWSKYTYTHTRIAGRMALPNDYIAATPVGHILNLGGEYTIAPVRVTLGGSAELAHGIEDSALTANGFQPVKGYSVFDLFGQWQPVAADPNWLLRLEANNIFDAKYISRASYAATSTVTPTYSEGRSFLLSSTLKF